MKRIHFLIIAAVFAVGFLKLPAAAQPAAPDAGWMRVASDKGEFAIDFPARYGYFTDNAGLSVSAGVTNLPARNMQMLNAFHEDTLVSVESYQAAGEVLDVLREREMRGGLMSDIKAAGFKIKQVVKSERGAYTVRRYFGAKGRVYILTAAARGAGETPAMKRFFDSLRFSPDGKPLPADAGGVPFANLRVTPIAFEPEAPPAPRPDMSPAPPDEAAKDLIIVSKPFASYTHAARQRGLSGTVVFRVTFEKDGWISKIGVVRAFGENEGVLRQCAMAALRIKFLPSVKPGAPETVTKTIEYSFSIG